MVMVVQSVDMISVIGIGYKGQFRWEIGTENRKGFTSIACGISDSTDSFACCVYGAGCRVWGVVNIILILFVAISK